MATLKYGSKGDDVKELQQALVNAGYNIGSSGVDGSYGPATQAAVTQYQKDYGLQVDGLAGPETQGALYSSGNKTTGSSGGGYNVPVNTPVSTPASAPSTSSGGTTGGTRDYTGTTYQSNDYHQDAIDAAAAGDWDKAMEALNNREIVVGAMGNNYGKTSMDIFNELQEQYGGPQSEMDRLYALVGDLQKQLSQPIPTPTPSWGDTTYEELLKQAVAMNYDDWTQSDQYKSLAERYGAQGRMSMQDVLGQISSRTGGLASSYATTASQQQYNEYMSQLEEVARQMFAGERSDLIENAGLARDYGEMEYGRYLDQLNMQNDRNSYALDIINKMMGYQQGKADTQYAQEQDAKTEAQNSKTEAQERINTYLAAYGSVAELDPDLVRASGYTQGELATLEKYYADQREKEAAAAAAKNSGSGSGGGGNENTGDADIYQTMYDKGVTSEGTAYSWLLANGYNSTTAGKLAGYFSEWMEARAEPEEEPTKPTLPSTGSATASAYGPSYNTAWGQARKMYDNGKSDQEILDYLDTFTEDRLTDEGLRYIMNSLHLGGYKE